jgi:hypothetical protein
LQVPLILALKAELSQVRVNNKGQAESQESVVVDLRKRIQELEASSVKRADESNQTGEMETELKEKRTTLKEARENETSLKNEIQLLRQRLSDTEADLSKVTTFIAIADRIECGRTSIS